MHVAFRGDKSNAWKVKNRVAMLGGKQINEFQACCVWTLVVMNYCKFICFFIMFLCVTACMFLNLDGGRNSGKHYFYSVKFMQVRNHQLATLRNPKLELPIFLFGRPAPHPNSALPKWSLNLGKLGSFFSHVTSGKRNVSSRKMDSANYIVFVVRNARPRTLCSFVLQNIVCGLMFFIVFV